MHGRAKGVERHLPVSGHDSRRRIQTRRKHACCPAVPLSSASQTFVAKRRCPCDETSQTLEPLFSRRPMCEVCTCNEGRRKKEDDVVCRHSATLEYVWR